MRYTLNLRQSDYIGATTLLNTLPASEEDDSDFYETQIVNIKRLSIPEYYPDSTEWATLEQIAEKSSSSGAYAKAIITYYDARSWDTDFPEYPEDSSSLRPVAIEEPIQEVAHSDWKLYPNPSNGRIMIAVHGGTHEKQFIQVRTLLGSLCYSQEILNEGSSNVQELDLSTLTPGLYFVSLIRDGIPAGTRPLFIQK